MIFYEGGDVIIRSMLESDIDYFADEFAKLNWGGRKDALLLYFREQGSFRRDVLVAVYKSAPAGYVTLIPSAKQGPFADMNIPEIKDFIVLPQFRRLGIGSILMDCVESLAKSKSNRVCLGVGLYSDYGAAQRMYVKRGYIPDGSGVWHNNKNLAPYENCVNDDGLNLYFVKHFT